MNIADLKPVETIGYICRTISATEQYLKWSQGPFIIQSVLILVAPALFAASIYMELGRIVMMVEGEKKLFIRRSWMTKIFVLGDVASFLTQAAGAGLLATADDADTVSSGNDIIIVGLFVQVVFFAVFVATGALFHRRLAREPTPASTQMPWRRHMLGLYVVSVLIFVRSVVRVIEYIQGNGGYISKSSCQCYHLPVIY